MCWRIGARLVTVFSIHATKKLLSRVKQPAMPAVSEPTTALGNWYATAMFWKPQVGLLVNERTLYPVLMPLAPAATLMARFPGSLPQTLQAGGVAADFIESEIAAMGEGRYAKTANRSVIGIMNEFSCLSAHHPGGRTCVGGAGVESRGLSGFRYPGPLRLVQKQGSCSTPLT